MKRSVAELYLEYLASSGIDFIFANAGTDFAPIIEAYVARGRSGAVVPRPIIASHENVAVSMAIGNWMVTGKMQACMVHVNVGTANAICGLLNAARGSVPMLFTAGRTPVTESGQLGSRNLGVHWTQEMFDQAGMVREAVKWEYELRNSAQLGDVVQRAVSVGNAYPKGPVYLTLPREVLASEVQSDQLKPSRQAIRSVPPSISPETANAVVDLIARSEFPILITSQLGYDRKAGSLLPSFVEATGIAVIEASPSCVSLSADHSFHAGYDPHALLPEADLILVIDCPVPWIPQRAQPAVDAKIVHIGVDPLFSVLPMRSFQCDLALCSTAGEALDQLNAALGTARLSEGKIARRKSRIDEHNDARRKKAMEVLERVKHLKPIHPVWASHCIGQLLNEETVLLRESPQLSTAVLNLRHAGGSFSGHFAGGLGWGLGAAIGVKLADPSRTVITVEGDGSYIFSTPVAAHHSALENDAPFLTVIMDNHGWNEVHAATTHVYPDGHAARGNRAEPLTYFSPKLLLEKTIETVGGVGFRVSDPEELPEQLAQAIDVVRSGRQAVLTIVCSST